MPRGALLGILLGLSACSSKPRVLTLDVTTGKEDDAFSLDPKVTEVKIRGKSLDGETVEATAKPGGSFDLGDVAGDELFTFEATGTTAAGETVVRGRTLSGISPDNVGGKVIPLFVQRLGSWARPPGGLDRSQADAVGGVVGERFLMVVGGMPPGDSKPADAPDYYDLFALTGSRGSAFPRTPETIVTLDEAELLINGAGATWLLVDGSFGTAVLPEGLGSFADVARGRSIPAPDGRVFVVGAARGTDATRAVLVVEQDQTLSALLLNHPRAGASVAWIEGAGLVVAGGSADGPGVEMLADGASAFVTKPFPADATIGAALVATASTGAVLVGGSEGGPAPTRRIDPGCGQHCRAKPIADAGLPAELVGVRAFALPSGKIIAVGEEPRASGHTRSFVVDLGGDVVEAPLREARRGASVIPAPNGTLGLVGGLLDDGGPALSVELFFPE